MEYTGNEPKGLTEVGTWNKNIGFFLWRDRSSGFALRYDPVCSTGVPSVSAVLRKDRIEARKMIGGWKKSLQINKNRRGV